MGTTTARGGVIVHVRSAWLGAKRATHVSEAIPFAWDVEIVNGRQDMFEAKVACIAAMSRSDWDQWPVIEMAIDPCREPRSCPAPE